MVCICFQATYVIRVVNISVNDTVQIKMSDDLILLSFTRFLDEVSMSTDLRAHHTHSGRAPSGATTKGDMPITVELGTCSSRV